MRKLVLIVSLLFCSCSSQATSDTVASEPIRYVAMGDSLTIGDGVEPNQAWPSLLVSHFTDDGVEIDLYKNIAKSGWMTDETLAGQLPQLTELQPNFVTLLIGANDLFASRRAEEFYLDYITLLDGILAEVPADRVLVMTIPDYTRTPIGFLYGDMNEFKQLIAAYNSFIREQAQIRDVTIVDMHKQSKWVMLDVGLLSDDGIHPSVKGHQKWEEVIYPLAKASLAR